MIEYQPLLIIGNLSMCACVCVWCVCVSRCVCVCLKCVCLVPRGTHSRCTQWEFSWYLFWGTRVESDIFYKVSINIDYVHMSYIHTHSLADFSSHVHADFSSHVHAGWVGWGRGGDRWGVEGRTAFSVRWIQFSKLETTAEYSSVPNYRNQRVITVALIFWSTPR